MWQRHWQTFAAALQLHTAIVETVDWPSFATLLQGRLAAGHSEYGDQSFRRSPEAISGEIAEEFLDVSGWSFVLWVRAHECEDYTAERYALALAVTGFEGWLRVRAERAAYVAAAQ